MTTEGPADVRGKQEDSNGRQRAVRPMKRAEATAKGKMLEYVCPHCNQSVSSTIRTGKVNHRRTCGNYFRVREGRPCAKLYDYVCPACNGHVASNVATGQIDHRTVCGNQFSVQDGVVKEKGVVYRCPFCKGHVRSDVRTGQIDHRTVCGNNFSVQDRWRCERERHRLQVSILQGKCEKRCQDKARQPSNSLWEPILCEGLCGQQENTVSCAQLPGVLNCCLVIAVMWAHCGDACHAVGKNDAR